MNEMRFLVGKSDVDGYTHQNPLGDLIGRSMRESGGRWNVNSLRLPGIREMQWHEDDERSQFRANAPLPDRAQILMDRAVVRVGMSRLTVAADIIAAGLTYPLADPLSVTQLEWNSTNKTGNAQRSMTPEARTENFIPALLANRLPIYLTMSGTFIGIRELRMSQRMGMPLDTAQIEASTRMVNEYVEDATINGAQTIDGQEMKVAGYAQPGLLNAPGAVTSILTAASWDVTPVAATIMAEVQAGLAKLRANKFFGPFTMYVNTEVGATLDNDYTTTTATPITIRQRLLGLEGLTAIKTADMIPGGTAGTYVGAKVAIIQMTSDVVDMVIGQRPTVIPWTSLTGFTFHNLVMAILIPRFRANYDGVTGIWIGTLT